MWDWLPTHRSPMFQECFRQQEGQIHVEYAHARAPGRNPAKYLRDY